MPLELRLLTGLTLALAVVYAATPVAIRVANRFEFYDRPVGYKAHGTPTPYLGGAAVVAGFVIAVALLSREWERTLPLIGGTVLMWALGTWDDRRPVTPQMRVFLEVAIAALIWQLGYGWELGLGAGIDLVVTCVWVVAVINAFNLFDNMDGATPSMGTVSAAGLSLLGIAQGNTWLAVAGVALCGACAGFLPHNLSSPARIFLGDGGSMPIGFAVATLTMIGVSESAVELQSLAMGLLFVGIPALDTTLVMISRRRRGIPLLTGGRDHLTHRTRVRLRTARAVAIALGSTQAIISILAIVALHRGASAIAGAVAIYLVAAGDRDRGARHALGGGRDARRQRHRPAECGDEADPPAPHVDGAGGTRPRSLAAAAAAPFFEGYYHPRLWIPGALVVVVMLTVGLIAAPVRLTRPALLFLGGVAALMALSLFSAVWADSIEAAVTEANRLALYLALTGLLLVVLRTDAAAAWLVGGLAAAVAAGGAVVIARMLGSEPTDLFIGGRLDEPLGYINGQAAFLLLGGWCCLAVAEQRRSALLAGAGMAGAALLAALLMLSQSRGVALAALASIMVVLAIVPGRLRRVAALAVLGTGVALAGPPLLAVYQAARSGSLRRRRRPRRGEGGVDRRGAQRPRLGRSDGPTASGGVHDGARAPVRDRRPGGRCSRGGRRGGRGARLHRRLGRTPVPGVHARRRAGPATASASRLASGSGNRYDYWRIAWRTFEDRPLLGVGAGNYDRPYFKLRATEEDVTQPHSVELQVLSELGLLGPRGAAGRAGRLGLGRMGAGGRGTRLGAGAVPGGRRRRLRDRLARPLERGLAPPAPRRDRRRPGRRRAAAARSRADARALAGPRHAAPAARTRGARGDCAGADGREPEPRVDRRAPADGCPGGAGGAAGGGGPPG